MVTEQMIMAPTLTESRPTALVADDQPDILEALRILLKGEGFLVEAATSPAAVLERLGRGSSDFDVLLMDLNYARDTTSGQEGLDLLTRVRAIDGILPVVVMTAWGSIELAVEAMRRGVGDFVIKPWENDRLLQTVRSQVVAGRRLRRLEKIHDQKAEARRSLEKAQTVKTVCKTIFDALANVIGHTSVFVFNRESSSHIFSILSGTDTDSSESTRIELDSIRPVETLSVMSEAGFPPSDAVALRSLGIESVIGVCFEGRTLGLIGLRNDHEASPEVGDFVSGLSAMMATALHNMETKRQERDYREALGIQKTLLPTELPVVPGFDICSAWLPARIVGGDYYDALKLGEESLGLCIADVSGKGMAAALLMSNLQAIVRACSAAGASPKDICARINGLMAANLASGKFVTLFYAVLDCAKRRLVYTNAGHNAPILRRSDGTIERLKDGGTVLGAFPDWEYEECEIDLQSGDRLILFTDGVTEAVNARDEDYSERRLLNLIAAKSGSTAFELKDSILESVMTFAGDELQDDATLLICGVN